MGGICDWNKGKILNCYNEAPITSTGQAAGIVRDNKGYVANCYNKGALTGTYVGGIAAGTGVAEGGAGVCGTTTTSLPAAVSSRK